MTAAYVAALPFHYSRITPPFPQSTSEPDLLLVSPISELPLQPIDRNQLLAHTLVDEETSSSLLETLEPESSSHSDTSTSPTEPTIEMITFSAQHLAIPATNETELQLETLMPESELATDLVVPELELTTEDGNLESETIQQPTTISSIYVPPSDLIPEELEFSAESVAPVEPEVLLDLIIVNPEFLDELPLEPVTSTSHLEADSVAHTIEPSSETEEPELELLIVSIPLESGSVAETITFESELIDFQTTPESEIVEDPVEIQELEITLDLVTPSTEYIPPHFPEENEIELPVEPATISPDSVVTIEIPMEELLVESDTHKHQVASDLIILEPELTLESVTLESELSVEPITHHLDLSTEPIIQEFKVSSDFVILSLEYQPPILAVSEGSDPETKQTTTETESIVHPVTSTSEPVVHPVSSAPEPVVHPTTFGMDQSIEIQTPESTIPVEVAILEIELPNSLQDFADSFIVRDLEEPLITPSSRYVLPLFKFFYIPDLRIEVITTGLEAPLDPVILHPDSPAILQVPESEKQTDSVTLKFETANNINDVESEVTVHPIAQESDLLLEQTTPFLVSEQTEVSTEPIPQKPELQADLESDTTELPTDSIHQELDLSAELQTMEPEMIDGPTTPHPDLPTEEETFEVKLPAHPFESVDQEFEANLNFLLPTLPVSNELELEIELVHTTISELELTTESVTSQPDVHVESTTHGQELPINSENNDLELPAETIRLQYVPPNPPVFDSKPIHLPEDLSWSARFKNWLSKTL